jgi:hypothetical protein
LGALFAVVTFQACAQDAIPQVVDRAFPKALDDPDYPLARQSTFEVSDFNRDGHPLIVALYSNGMRGQLVMLDRAGLPLSTWTKGLKGRAGELRLEDLDGDGVAEVVAQMYAGHGAQIPDSWVFAWRNKQLALISPTARVGKLDVTPLSMIAVLDLDGSGKKALLALPGEEPDEDDNKVDNGPAILYTLADGRYVETSTKYLYAQRFFRQREKPAVVNESFRANGGPAVLCVVNGVDGGGAVSSGHVLLNETEVVRPADFKLHVHSMSFPVPLKDGVNSITVELDGKPGAGIWLLIEPRSSSAKTGTSRK